MYSPPSTAEQFDPFTGSSSNAMNEMGLTSVMSAMTMDGPWTPYKQVKNTKGQFPQSDNAFSSVYFHGRLWICWRVAGGNGNLRLAVRTTTDPNATPEYFEYDLSGLTGATSTHQPTLVVFNDQLYVFWKGNAATGYNIWYTKTDGSGSWTSCVSLGADYGFNTGQAPTAIDFNGRLWLGWVDETPVANGRFYIWVASSPDGTDWTNASQVYIDTTAVSDQGFAISPYDVTLATFDNTLWVFFSSVPSDNRNWYAPIKPIPGKAGPSPAKMIPNWGISSPCAVTSSRGRQFVFATSSAGDIWYTVRYPGKPDTWDLPINLKTSPANAISKAKPTATVIPGYPGGEPWRVWLIERGFNTNYLWESTFPY